MTKIGEIRESIFTGDVCIAKKNLPVLALVCVCSLVGAMYFGMFFARQEVLDKAQIRQDEIVKNFAVVTGEKDTQIRTLTTALSDIQDSHKNKLTTIEALTTEIALYLATSQAPLDEERVQRLQERIRQIQATAKLEQPKPLDGAVR